MEESFSLHTKGRRVSLHHAPGQMTKLFFCQGAAIRLFCGSGKMEIGHLWETVSCTTLKRISCSKTLTML